MQNLPTKLFTGGLILLFGTICIFWVVVPGAIKWKVTQTLRFEDGNEIFEEFTNIKVEILFKVFIFNVTNPDDVASGKSLPKLDEIGPYVYEEKRTNIPVHLDPENDTFTYQSTVVFHFRPDLSAGSDEDVITVLNVPIVAVANELNNWSRMIRYMAKAYITSFQEPLFVERKVRTVLFDGVHLELIESVSDILGMNYLPNNTFGYFYEKNATITPNYVVHAGVQDNSKFGKIITWKGQEKLDIWNGEHCNMINGSDTSLYPPFITKDSILRGYEADICRSVYMVFKKEDQVNGINGLRFGLPEDFFDGNSSYNECFCSESDKSKCPKNGALSISACRWGAPLFISHPHFLYGDPSYNELTGLSPGIPEIHESYAILEPTTGAVLKGSRRMQLNIQMRKSKDIPELNNVQDALVPLFWVDDAAVQPDRTLDDLRWRMVIPLKVVEVSKWFMLCSSSILILVAISIFMLRSKNKKPVEYY
ncbi:scavenger receptor class B member 1 [Folsomia candida]|uniref:Scavenger receptor class B member 1 n=1 Tax=Folsomia candida TaxID=158441 RepID=A0A226EH73_FOLCA|nr:scavenger receptor class B member 1 [Folsomia candida]OXA57013.1 Scavenger receptor class B member 1 [Folsomia candida]